MKSLLKLMLVGWLLVGVGVAAEQPNGVARNLAWAALTLEKVTKDLGEIACEPKGPDAVALASAEAAAHARLAALQQVTATADAESERASKAADFTKNLAGLAQWTIDRAGDLAGKQLARRNLFTEHAALAKTDYGKQLDEVLVALASCALRQAAAQLAEQQVLAGEAEGAWNNQALRFDQLMDEADDEAGWLDHKAELQDAIRESGKQIKLTDVEAARAKMRAARHAQQQVAQDKQNLANQTARLNLQIQMLDEKGGQLKDAADKAHEAFDAAQGKIQEALQE